MIMTMPQTPLWLLPWLASQFSFGSHMAYALSSKG